MLDTEKSSYSTKEFAAALSMPIPTVSKWIQVGKIAAVRGINGRYAIPRAELERIQQQQQEVDRQIAVLNGEGK